MHGAWPTRLPALAFAAQGPVLTWRCGRITEGAPPTSPASPRRCEPHALPCNLSEPVAIERSAQGCCTARSCHWWPVARSSMSPAGHADEIKPQAEAGMTSIPAAADALQPASLPQPASRGLNGAGAKKAAPAPPPPPPGGNPACLQTLQPCTWLSACSATGLAAGSSLTPHCI